LEGTLKTPDKNSKKNLIIELPIKPHEQRALNFLINEYLLARSYKLTSITFSDECEEQDFEDWQDVGLNIPKPKELLQIYREYMRANGYDKLPSISVAVQTDFVIKDVEEQKDESLEMVCYFNKEVLKCLNSRLLKFVNFLRALFFCRQNRLKGCSSKLQYWSKRKMLSRKLFHQTRKLL